MTQGHTASAWQTRDIGRPDSKSKCFTVMPFCLPTSWLWVWKWEETCSPGGWAVCVHSQQLCPFLSSSLAASQRLWVWVLFLALKKDGDHLEVMAYWTEKESLGLNGKKATSDENIWLKVHPDGVNPKYRFLKSPDCHVWGAKMRGSHPSFHLDNS